MSVAATGRFSRSRSQISGGKQLGSTYCNSDNCGALTFIQHCKTYFQPHGGVQQMTRRCPSDITEACCVQRSVQESCCCDDLWTTSVGEHMIGQTALQPQRSIFIHGCLSRSLLQTQMHLDYVTDGSNDTGDSNEVGT